MLPPTKASRGRLVGVLVYGERAGGESYAADEVEALTELAQGVGSALESMERSDRAHARTDAIFNELRSLREGIERSTRGGM